MKSNKALIAAVVLVVIIAGFLYWKKGKDSGIDITYQTNTNKDVSESSPTPTPTNTPSETPDLGTAVNADTNTPPEKTNEVKEFAMTAFYELVDGQPKTQFSLKEISVKKGDRVRIKVTNTKGVHDFKLDEFNIFKETPLNEEVVMEFTADKAGEFIYYCSKPNHRAWGQWGTLKVTE